MENFKNMDPYFYVPPGIREDNPIIISSPCVRAGTTLLQRLLCSSENILVYGEYCAVELHFQLNYYLSRVLFFANNKKQRDAMLAEVLAGKVNQWISDIMPEMESYIRNLTENYLGMFSYYKKFAHEKGRALWGTKVAGWNWQQLNLLAGLMKNSQIVYIYRNVEQCLASAKSAGMIYNESDVQQFCMHWYGNMESLWQQRQNPRVLLVDFGELISNSPKVIGQLESFCSTPGIDRQVMSHRVNSLPKNGDHSDPANYTPPAILTKKEKEIVTHICRPLMEKIFKEQNNEKTPGDIEKEY